MALWWLVGNRLVLGTNDEGIYLDAAERILRGQKPYVDFFGYMTPGSFWIQTLAFGVFGVTQAAARVPVVLDIALECALISWLVERYASRACAWFTTSIFFAFEIADPSMTTAQHRWDSGALALASIALCICGGRWRLLASGFLACCAALATPSVALVAIVTMLWLRARSGWYLIGIAVGGLAAALALQLSGIMGAFAGQLAWLSHNYSAVNVMPYGAVIGGYRALFQGASPGELPIRFCIVLCLALPALLPLVTVAGGAMLWRRERIEVLPYLLLCIIALVVSTHPRSDVAHLADIAALPYAAAGILAYRGLGPRPRAWLAAFVGVWAAVFAWQGQAGHWNALRTPVGEVRADAGQAPGVALLLARVRPHQSLFVYPYKPLFYFLTQAENPTRYSYLAPGMMTAQDALVALSELQSRPPDWVLYMDLTQAEFERVFPSGKSFDAHFPTLENWIKANYRSSGGPSLSGYALLQRR